MRYVASVGDSSHIVEIEANGHLRRVSVDGREFTIDWQQLGDERHQLATGDDPRANHYSILAGGRSYEVYARPVASDSPERAIEVIVQGRPYHVTVGDERTQALAKLAGGAHISGDVLIRAPMPGLVTNVLAAEGTEVHRGQTVIVLEAMKMENDLTAPRAGIVKSVRVARGQTVNQHDILAVVGDPAGSSPEPEAEEE